ncbi:MAG TPA: DedA family protein [Anaerolineales bacterium]|nr:DedA family protein [Anaerolineales bacterium]
MSDFLLTQVINYGAPILGGIVFISALGIPLPATLVVIAAGAFSREGFLPWHITGLVAWICVVVGDCIGYAAGYYVRGPLLRRIGSSDRWLQAENYFQRWGGMSVFLTRFLVTGIASPVNIIAGMGNISFRTFLIYDVTGEGIWVFGYGGLGYLFGPQWEVVSEFMSSFGGLILGILLLGIGVWLARRKLKRIEDAKGNVPEA